MREAARMLDISPSSCGRLMSELRDEGVLTQNTENRSYSLAGRVIRWASVYTGSSDLRKKAYPHMEHMAKETNETVSLYTAEEYDRVCVERIESQMTVRIVEPVGTRIPICKGSGGKAILAFRTKEEIERDITCAQSDPRYQVNEDFFTQLKSELAEIRQSGYAVSHGEWQSDASGIASPIFNERGVPIGSISVSGPTQRFLDNNKLKLYAELLKKHVGMISRELGYAINVR